MPHQRTEYKLYYLFHRTGRRRKPHSLSAIVRIKGKAGKLTAIEQLYNVYCSIAYNPTWCSLRRAGSGKKVISMHWTKLHHSSELVMTTSGCHSFNPSAARYFTYSVCVCVYVDCVQPTVKNACHTLCAVCRRTHFDLWCRQLDFALSIADNVVELYDADTSCHTTPCTLTHTHMLSHLRFVAVRTPISINNTLSNNNKIHILQDIFQCDR